jgi:hypothetical protein
VCIGIIAQSIQQNIEWKWTHNSINTSYWGYQALNQD